MKIKDTFKEFYVDHSLKFSLVLFFASLMAYQFIEHPSSSSLKGNDAILGIFILVAVMAGIYLLFLSIPGLIKYFRDNIKKYLKTRKDFDRWQVRAISAELYIKILHNRTRELIRENRVLRDQIRDL
jgi:hypothetical protein